VVKLLFFFYVAHVENRKIEPTHKKKSSGLLRGEKNTGIGYCPASATSSENVKL
jgi:hypothetical protein